MYNVPLLYTLLDIMQIKPLTNFQPIYYMSYLLYLIYNHPRLPPKGSVRICELNH